MFAICRGCKGCLQGSCLGLEKACHILDAEDVDSLSDELIDEIEVVFQRVLGLRRVSHIAAVADRSLDDTTGLLGGVNTELQLQNDQIRCQLSLSIH